MSEIERIGMYSTDEILEFMTNGEGRGFLGRSMFDAMYFEIERLNNIINEFDKWLLGEKMMFYKGSDDERLIRFSETKNKWLELKGVDKE